MLEAFESRVFASHEILAGRQRLTLWRWILLQERFDLQF
jgi:hypothetical protein